MTKSFKHNFKLQQLLVSEYFSLQPSDLYFMSVRLQADQLKGFHLKGATKSLFFLLSTLLSGFCNWYVNGIYYDYIMETRLKFYLLAVVKGLDVAVKFKKSFEMLSDIGD